MGTTRAQLLALIYPLLDSNTYHPEWPIRVSVRDGNGARISWVFHRHEFGSERDPAGPVVQVTQVPEQPEWMGRIHMKLLEHATTTPVPAKVLIARTGYELNSYSRQSVTDLVRAGLLQRTPDGIKLPDPPSS